MELWERRRILGAETLRKKRLYLDVRFWNDFCDVAIGECDDVAAKDSFAAVSSAVDADCVICPIEFYVFSELQKQRLSIKRRATARLVDSLSKGVTIISPPERVFLELLRFVQAFQSGKSVPERPLLEVWTRPIHIVGHAFPALPGMGLPQEIVEQLRDQFYEDMWLLGYEDLAELAGGDLAPIDDRVTTAKHLNVEKDKAQHRLRTYKETYEAELLGALDGNLAELIRVWDYLWQASGRDVSGVPLSERRRAAMKLRNLIHKAWFLNDLTQALPSLHIGAALYAHIQWDRPRRYRPNDLFDIGHAEAAIPYCSAFATDGPFAVLLNNSGVANDFGCHLISTHSELTAWIDNNS